MELFSKLSNDDWIASAANFINVTLFRRNKVTLVPYYMNFFSSLSKLLPPFSRGKIPTSTENISGYEQKLIQACLGSHEEALQLLGSSEQGLTEEQAEAFFQEYGTNDFGKKPHQGFIKEILIR